jgi:uncharacterized protein with FMN-binding domain
MNSNQNNPTQNLGLALLITLLGFGSFGLIFGILTLQQKPQLSVNSTALSSQPEITKINITASSSQIISSIVKEISSIIPIVEPKTVPKPIVAIPTKLVETPVIQPTPAPVVQPKPVAPSTTYADGNYSTNSISYSVPGGQNDLAITSLSLKGDVISDITISNNYSGRGSSKYDSRFQNSIKSKVVGKKLKDVSNAYVSGASLTSDAFDSALQSVMSQAKL